MTAVTLPRVEVPDDTVRDATLGAVFYTGEHAIGAVLDMPAGTDVAIDIETPSVTDSFTLKCVTASWESGGDTHCVLLDPARRPPHAHAARELAARARWLILHNAPFDTPGLVAAELITLDQIGKIMDTLVFARAAWPDTLERKGLEALADRVLSMRELPGALKLAIRASGYGSKERWFAEGDIDMPTYRRGAMSDTVVTLRLAMPLFEAAVRRQLDHPFSAYGHTDRSTATELILSHQRANRVMLRRAARGLEIDTDYLDRYVETVEVERRAAEATITAAGLRPGVGADVVNHLDSTGELPSGWPRTRPTKTRPNGTLRADKDTLEHLDHPLAVAHRRIAHTKKVTGYMDKVAARSRITGRLHPQFQILGASATGRMSAAEPELQQFPEEARPIIIDSGSGIQSTDWSSIEPALLAWLGGDWDFITPFEQGADLYQPIVEMCGVPRKTAKVILLALMYGRGNKSMAASLGVSLEEAAAMKGRLLRAMPKAVVFARKVQQIAEVYGLALTVAGRVVTVPSFNGEVASYKAVNYTIQGSNADMIYTCINALDEMGLSDGIMIPMHDELVTTADIAAEVQRVMETPMPALLRRTQGRDVVIRTDSVYLGHSWSVLTAHEQIAVRTAAAYGEATASLAERYKVTPTTVELLLGSAA